MPGVVVAEWRIGKGLDAVGNFEMRPYNQELLNRFYAQDLSKAELVDRFDLEGHTPAAFISREIAAASEKESADDLEDAITLAFAFDATSIPAEKWNALLLEDWHFKHEDIASLLQDIKSESSVASLFQVCQTRYAYLEFDDSHALAVKCIWALGDINNEDARLRLAALCRSEVGVIRSNAEQQLKRVMSSESNGSVHAPSGSENDVSLSSKA